MRNIWYTSNDRNVQYVCDHCGKILASLDSNGNKFTIDEEIVVAEFKRNSIGLEHYPDSHFCNIDHYAKYMLSHTNIYLLNHNIYLTNPKLAYDISIRR